MRHTDDDLLEQRSRSAQQLAAFTDEIRLKLQKLQELTSLSKTSEENEQATRLHIQRIREHINNVIVEQQAGWKEVRALVESHSNSTPLTSSTDTEYDSLGEQLFEATRTVRTVSSQATSRAPHTNKTKRTKRLKQKKMNHSKLHRALSKRSSTVPSVHRSTQNKM
jgi:hypothetical protein